MRSIDLDPLADAIDEELDYLHKQRWSERAAQLHAAEIAADNAGNRAERVRIRQELVTHYADRFRPETSRDVLIAQAMANHQARRIAARVLVN